MIKPVCYLDLDGCLVDFVGGALATHGKRLEPGEVRWDFHTQMGLTAEQFWAPFGHGFWAGLGWCADGHLILHTCERLFGPENVVLLTSPCDTPGCLDGKLAWVRRELPDYCRRFLIGPPKHLAAAPGKVLVDDHDANVDRFVEHCGQGVLIPRPWNRRGIEAPRGRAMAETITRDLESAHKLAAWFLSHPLGSQPPSPLRDYQDPMGAHR